MSKDSFVYFVQNTLTGHIKIGVTTNINRRIKQLNTANSNDLKLIYYVNGSKDVEYAFHQRYKDDKVNREWFLPKRIRLWIENDMKTREAKMEYIEVYDKI